MSSELISPHDLVAFEVSQYQHNSVEVIQTLSQSSQDQNTKFTTGYLSCFEAMIVDH